MKLKIIILCLSLLTFLNANTLKPINQCLGFSVYQGLVDYYKGYPDNLTIFDKNGVIIYNKVPENRKYHFNLISRFGISSLKAYCENNDFNALKSAHNQALYLMKMSTQRQDFTTWLYDFEGGG